MKQKIYLASRIILGIIFLVFGANGLMMVLTGTGFIPTPPPKPEVMEIMGGFFKIGYLMPLVKSLQIIAGILLLWGRFINLAITLLAPIIVNILCVHLFIELDGLPMAIFIVVLFSILISNQWNDLKIILKKSPSIK